MFKQLFSFFIILLSVFSLILGIMLWKNPDNKKSDKNVPLKFNFMDSVKEFDTNSKYGIGVVYIYGTIATSLEESIFDIYARGSDNIVDQLESLRRNNKVKAIVIRINSPGGTIGAAQEISEEIKRIQHSGKKVIVSMADLAASGAYYISAQADLIIANSGTLTGSIGVYMASPEFSEFMKKYGLKYNMIKSGKYKDILSPFREMTNDDRLLLEKNVMDCYDQFVTDVSKGRKISFDKILKIADGRLFTGREALKLGLVDELGTFKYALERATKLAGLSGTPNIIRARKDNFKAIFNLIDSKLNIKNIISIFTKREAPIKYEYDD